jgi:hypothetical protein
MNPFSEAIRSTRRPSALYSPSLINKLVDEIEPGAIPQETNLEIGTEGSLETIGEMNSDVEPLEEEEIDHLIGKLHEVLGDDFDAEYI